MPIITLSGFSPSVIYQEKLNALMDDIATKVASVEELEIRSDQVTVFLDTGYVPRQNKKELIVFVRGLLISPRRTEDVFATLSRILGELLRQHQWFKGYLIEVFVEPVSPTRAWSSAA